MIRALPYEHSSFALIDRVVGDLDVAVRGGRVPNPLVAGTSQAHVRQALWTALNFEHLYANDNWFIFAEPGKPWFSPEKVLFENLVFPLHTRARWDDVPRLLRGIARMHGLQHVLFGDMFGVASQHYRKAAGVKSLGRSFITQTN